MKEKLKKLLENKKIKIFIWLIIGLFIIKEMYNIYLDIYSFQQLEKAKVILNNLKKDEYKFYTLEKFNKKYLADIHPTNNCYYVSNNNGKYPYIFGFKLESKILQLFYLKGYYVYPGYDKAKIPQCAGSNIGMLGLKGGCIKDILYFDFLETISNPCGD